MLFLWSLLQGLGFPQSININIPFVVIGISNQYPLIWLIIFDLLVTYIPACMRTSIYTSIQTDRQDRTGQDRTGQDRTGPDRTGQDKTRQDKTDKTDKTDRQTDRPTDRPTRQAGRQDKTRQDKTRPDQTRPDQTRPDRQTDRHAHYRVSTWYLL